MSILKEILKKLLLNSLDQLESDSCNLSEQELMKIIDTIKESQNGYQLSRTQVCEYLNISKSTLDKYIKLSYLPKGNKVKGFKELSWNKFDIDQCVEKNITKMRAITN